MLDSALTNLHFLMTKNSEGEVRDDAQLYVGEIQETIRRNRTRKIGCCYRRPPQGRRRSQFFIVGREPHADIELLGMVVTWDTG